MWDAKGLMQIEMADIRAHVAGAAETDLRVHVSAIEINLTAM